MAKRVALLVALFSLVGTSMALASSPNHEYGWELTPTGSTARLRGLSAVSERVAWASGSVGTVLRTTDKGATWQSVGPPGTSALQFRDIEAFDASTAVILSIGSGTDSRIYRTTDGGQTWTLVFQNQDPAAFYDCMAWFNKHRGLALSDPVNGRFRILATNDGGQTWQVVDADMPPALPLRVRLRRERPVHHDGRRPRRLVRDRRGRDRTRLPLRRPRAHLDGREHPGTQRAERRHLRARVQRSAARTRSRRPVRRTDRVARRPCAHQRRRPHVEPRDGRS